MPLTDGILKKLAPDDAENERRREELFQFIQEKGVAAAVEMVKDRWGIVTSKSAISRFNVAEKGRRADDEMLDKLSVRAARAKKLSAEMRGGRVISPETLKVLDQAVFELAAVDPDSPRLERLAKILADMMRAADAEQNTRVAVDKFQRETCSLFLKWFEDEKARAIAASNAPNEEKIAALRREYFADVDALEKSGTVELPA